MNILEIRCDIKHANENKVKDFIEKTLLSKKWMYCKEFKKNDDKTEHFHLMVYTKYHQDTVRRKMKQTFKYLSGKKNEWKVGKVNDLIKYMSYIMKDGDYKTKNIKDGKLAEATIYMETLKEELECKTLKEKAILHLKGVNEFELLSNGDVMMEILNWFNKKKLKYPSQHWMKQVIIQYWMEINKNEDVYQKQQHLMKLYGIVDSFIDTKKTTI